jgi:hypothetical protein
VGGVPQLCQRGRRLPGGRVRSPGWGGVDEVVP